MEIKNRQGVLGLETSKQVMVTFLILAVTGIAVVLSLVTLQDSVQTSIDTQYSYLTTINESDSTGAIAFLNQTGYTLSNANASSSGWVILAVWGDANQSNGSQGGITNTPTGYTSLIATGNYSLNTTSAVLRNATSYNFPNVSVSYNYVYTYDSQRTDSIVGNISGGIVTFFGSTGTIFSILVVVVIILAISIIIWAVGRFGSQTEDSVTL